MEEKVRKQIVKVTHPDYFLEAVAPLVYEFAGKINMPGMSYESLMSYFMYSPGLENYVALVDDQPKGFMAVGAMGPPYYSTAIIHSIYKPEPDVELADLMYDKIVEFMKKHKLLYYYYIAVNKKVGTHFANKAKARGLTASVCGYYYSGKRTFKKR